MAWMLSDNAPTHDRQRTGIVAGKRVRTHDGSRLVEMGENMSKEQAVS